LAEAATFLRGQGVFVQGRVWSGSRALKIGLVDALGGLQTAITTAKKLAKLGKHPTVLS